MPAYELVTKLHADSMERHTSRSTVNYGSTECSYAPDRYSDLLWTMEAWSVHVHLTNVLFYCEQQKRRVSMYTSKMSWPQARGSCSSFGTVDCIIHCAFSACMISLYKVLNKYCFLYSQNFKTSKTASENIRNFLETENRTQ